VLKTSSITVVNTSRAVRRCSRRMPVRVSRAGAKLKVTYQAAGQLPLTTHCGQRLRKDGLMRLSSDVCLSKAVAGRGQGWDQSVSRRPLR
jgi:hypothetical protein